MEIKYYKLVMFLSYFSLGKIKTTRLFQMFRIV